MLDIDTILSAASRLETIGRVWAVPEFYAEELRALNGAQLSDRLVEALERHEETEARARAAAASPPGGSGVAVITLAGMITPRPSLLSLLFGGGDGSLKSLGNAVKAAVASPDVGSIVLDIDSPGGSADGIAEMAAELRKAADAKPIIAVANTTMGSGAYWLGSQAHEIVASPSAELGSIGAYRIYRNIGAALADSGISVEIVKAGKYKIENNPYTPMTDEGRAAAQQSVDDAYGMFVDDVAKGRGVEAQAVRDGYGEGRMLTAKRAVSAGLADRVATLDQTVARLASGRARIKRTDSRLTLEWPEEKDLATSGVDYTTGERERLVATLAGLA